MEQAKVSPGTLYVVATPIGNRRDISERAVDVLQSVDLIAAEDTRHSMHLLTGLAITTRLVSFHDFSDGDRLRSLLARLNAGQTVALISDAGTPGISDPGYELISLARQNDVEVVPVPGPSAVITALSVSGLPTDSFLFEGFLPARKQARRSQLEALKNEVRTTVFYESPHRIVDCLQDLSAVMGPERPLYIGRELTKKFETSYLGGIAECLERLESDPQQQKGEFVLVLAGADKEGLKEMQLREGLRVLKLLVDEVPLNRAAKIAAAITGAPRNALYRAGLQSGSG
jgi:16S rRNA (cytidine1402-2'-O)-methyltransferase